MEKVDKLPEYRQNLQDTINMINLAHINIKNLSDSIAKIQKDKTIDIDGTHIKPNIGYSGYCGILNGLFNELMRNKILLAAYSQDILKIMKKYEDID